MSLKINCFEIEQPIGVLYVGYVKHSELLKLIDVDTRKMDTELEVYMGIQRDRNKTRIKQIAKFIASADSTFPTSIVLNVKSDDIISKYNDKNMSMVVKDNKKVFQVLDGQHRLYSFLEAEDIVIYDLPVTIIIDADLETQAHLFTKINLNQTKVNKSLSFDLFEYSKTMSPYKVAHEITKTLNNTKGPFYKKIKMLGKSDSIAKDEFITQAAIVRGILEFISRYPMDDTNMIKKTSFKKYIKSVKRDYKIVFQEEYLDEKFDLMTQFFYDYFSLISKKWPNAWGSKRYILSKTTGYDAFMRAIKNYIKNNYERKEEIIKYNYLKALIDKVEIAESDLINIKYSSGGVGLSSLYKDIMKFWN